MLAEGRFTSTGVLETSEVGGPKNQMLESTMLVISDDPSLIELIDDVVRSIEGLKFAVLAGVDAAYSHEPWDDVSLVLIHLRRQGPTSEVTRLLRMVSAARRPVATLVVGDEYDADRALTLLRLGAAEYLARPLDISRLSYLLDVLTIRTRNASPARVASAVEAHHRFGRDPYGPIFDDVTPENDQLMGQVRRVAPQDTTILLSGETGTGKTRLATLIHELSPRRNEPFLVINCGALAPDVIESELFGHVEGAFAGAERDRTGKFAEVGRGTLFLDEIDSLPMTVQAKLLRVVEDRMFEVLGSSKSLPLRARLVAASNRPLEQEVAAHRFRSDLYYRLNVIGFHLPPLCERREIIPALASKFIAEFAARHRSEADSISDDALRMLEDYDWPGNIRELRNLVERAVALSHGNEIQVGDLPDSIARPGRDSLSQGFYIPSTIPVPSMASSTLAEIKRDAELARITEALEKHSNNRLRAASELGISRMTLYKKLYKYGLMQPGPASRDGVA